MNLFRRENLLLAKMINEAGGVFHFLFIRETLRVCGGRLKDGEFEFQTTDGTWERREKEEEEIISGVYQILGNPQETPGILKFGEVSLEEFVKIRDTSGILFTSIYLDEAVLLALKSDNIPELDKNWISLGRYYQ